MIKLENNEHLYYICNIGCDDETLGLAIIKDDDFPKFKEIIENLNKNSTYDCMPRIHVYKVDPKYVKETSEKPCMYLNDKTYKITIHWPDLNTKGVRVI